MPSVNVEDRVCILSRNGNEAELHYFSLPAMDQSWAFTVRTMNAFHQRERRRWAAADDIGEDPSVYCEIVKPDIIHKFLHLKELQAFSHDDFWSMLKAINYDFKKRRYEY